MNKLIAVIGAGECDSSIYELSLEVGRQIARAKFGLVCGGLGGVMEAAAKGCSQAGGLTVGIIPGDDPEQANPFIDIVIPSGMGIMRNLLVVRSAAGIIAISGKYGTLSELAFALQLNKPVVGLETWDVSESIIKAGMPEEALNLLLTRI